MKAILFLSIPIFLIFYTLRAIKKNKNELKEIKEHPEKNEIKDKIDYKNYQWVNYILGGLGLVVVIGFMEGFIYHGFEINIEAVIISSIVIIVLGYFVGKNKPIALLLSGVIFVSEASFRFVAGVAGVQGSSTGVFWVVIYGYAAWAFLKAFSSIEEEDNNLIKNNVEKIPSVTDIKQEVSTTTKDKGGNMFCVMCGKEVDDDSKFCAFCGAGLEEDFSKRRGGRDNSEKNSIYTHEQDKINTRAIEMINNWSIGDKKNKEFIKIEKKLATVNSVDLIKVMAYKYKDEFEEKISGYLNRDYELINRIGSVVYWMVFNGFIFYLAEKEVLNKRTVKKTVNYESLSRKFSNQKLDIINNKVELLRDNFIETKLINVRAFTNKFELTDAHFGSFRAASKTSFNTGYVIAETIWG